MIKLRTSNRTHFRLHRPPSVDRLVRRRLHRGDGGFALMVVLFVLLLTSLLVVALIGLSFTTAAFAGSQSVRDNRARAADAALQTTINQISRDPSGNLGFPYRVDASGAQVDNTDCSVPGTMAVGDPSVDVVVQCEPLQPDDGGSVTGALVGTSSSDFVRVVGSTNGGDLASTWKTWPWAATLADNPATVATEVYAGAAQNAINSAQTPTVLHKGSEPLSFASNLEVSRSAAALRDPVLAAPDGFDSAINVTGSYWQGAPDMLNSVAGRDTDPVSNPSYDANDESNTCGILQPLNSVWQVFGASIRTGSQMACSQDGSLRTLPSGQTAPRRDSLGLNWQTPGIIPPAPMSWTSKNIISAAQTVPACSPAANHDPANWIHINAGTYNRVETAKLNQMIRASGAGSCPNRTWIFNPGQYWFDVAPAAPSNDPLRNALVFNDPGAQIVFGTPVADLSAASFPSACDPAAAGALVTLSPRTSIRHAAGRLAMCGAATNNGSQAIWQSSGANLGWVAQPSDDTGVGGDFLSNQNGALALDGQYAETTWPCWNPVLQGWIDGSECDGFKEITISDLGGGDDPGGAPVDSLQVMINADAIDSNARGANLEIIVRPSAERGGGQCSMTYSPLPDDFVTMAYEVMNPAGGCATFIKDRSQLVGATVTVRFNMRKAWTDCPFLGFCFSTPAALRVDYIGLRVPWTPVPTSAGYSGASAYSNAGEVIKLDGRLAERRVNCSGWFFPWLLCDGSTSALVELQNFQDLASPDLTGTAAPGTTLKSALAVITAHSYNVNNGGSSTTLSVKRSNGTVLCSVRYPGAPGANSRYEPVPQVYDLLSHPPSWGNCRSQITSASQLVGASLLVNTQLSKSSDCSVFLSWIGYRDCSGWGTKIDHISLSTTSAITDPDGSLNAADAYDGPTSASLVTSNNAINTSVDAVVSVNGQVSMPRSDLDVHWNGPLALGTAATPVPGSSVMTPLFSGSGVYALTTNSINSSGSGTVGVLCCKPAKPSERSVNLVARAGSGTGEVIGVARVTISDVSTSPATLGLWAPGQRVTIEDWRSCPAGAATPALCSSV